MTLNDSKSCLPYVNKLVDECNSTYNRSIDKSLLMLNILLCLKKLRRILKILHLNLVIESRLLGINIVTNISEVESKIPEVRGHSKMRSPRGRRISKISGKKGHRGQVVHANREITNKKSYV